jgi:hypothetical protein
MFDNLSTSALAASIVWGALASGIFIYGWRQKSAIPLAGGVVMAIVSYYFLDSALYMSLASILIIVLMYWLKKRGD